MLYFSEMHGFNEHGEVVCHVTPALLLEFQQLVHKKQAFPVEKLIEEWRSQTNPKKDRPARSKPVLRLAQ